MANSKITDLNSLTAAAGDEIPVNRAGADGKVTVQGIADIALTVADEATDTTCFPVFVTAATGALPLKSNTGLTFNSNTGAFRATSGTFSSVLASANDSGALGASGTAFADLFLASGAVIDFAAGNVTLTHASGTLQIGSTNTLGWSTDLILGRAAAAKLRLGAADASSAVAQTLSVQNVVAGTSNTAGADLTIAASQGTGNAAGGNINFQVASAGSSGSSQNSLVTSVRYNADKSVQYFFPSLSANHYMHFNRVNSNMALEFYVSAGPNASCTMTADNTGSGGAFELRFGSGALIRWSSTAQVGTIDTGISRNGAGIIEINNGTAGTLRDLKARRYVAPAAGTLTIASGVVTVTGSFHLIDTEGAGASDDLDTINGGTDGALLVIRAANGARDVVVKDGTGNIQCAGDFTMNNTQDAMTLIFDNAQSAWIELSRSDNGA